MLEAKTHDRKAGQHPICSALPENARFIFSLGNLVRYKEIAEACFLPSQPIVNFGLPRNVQRFAVYTV